MDQDPQQLAAVSAAGDALNDLEAGEQKKAAPRRARKAKKQPAALESDGDYAGSDGDYTGSDGDYAGSDEEDESDEEYDVRESSGKKKRTSTGGKASAAAEKKPRRSSAADTEPEPDASAAAATAKQAAQLGRSIMSTINAQMVYRGKHKQSRVSVDFPCLPLAVVSALLGPELLAKATNSKKQLQAKVSNDEIADVLGWRFGKSLRYGAWLALTDGLTLKYSKEEQTLKVHGKYSMVR